MAHAHRYSHGRHDRSQQHNDEDEGGASRSKRSRIEYEELIAKERLEDLIAQLGNQSTIEQHETVQNDVHDLSVVLESEIAKFKDAIINVLVACSAERPDKIRVYATLIGLINLKNHAFVGEFLECLVRFSFYEHVRKSFGPRLAPMLLHDKPPECHYKYDIEEDFSAEVVQCAHRLIDAIRERCTPERAIEVLNTLPVPGASGGVENGGPSERHLLLKVDVFFSTLLFLGSKSFSHSFAALAKFHSVCKALVPLDNRPAKLRLLASLYECWRWHEQMLIVLLDKLVKVQLVDCQAVFDWLFGDCLGDSADGLLPRQELSRCYAWDAAESTLSKMCKQLAKLTEDWAKARQRYDSYHEKMRGGGGGDDEAQQMQTDLPGPAAMVVDEDTPTRDELDAKLNRLELARLELRQLVACLLRCGVWGAAGGGIPNDEGCSGRDDAEANDRHLRRLVYERSLACLTIHYNDVKPAMRHLRGHPPVPIDSAAAAEKFCEAFFSLSD